MPSQSICSVVPTLIILSAELSSPWSLTTQDNSLAYPVVLTVTAGTNTLNPLLEMALLQRVTQHVASRGDDTVALPSDYWDRICGMMGKGIG